MHHERRADGRQRLTTADLHALNALGFGGDVVAFESPAETTRGLRPYRLLRSTSIPRVAATRKGYAMPDGIEQIEELGKALILLADAVEKVASADCNFDATGDAQAAREMALIALRRPLPAPYFSS